MSQSDYIENHLKILVVDDDPETNKAASYALMREGYEVMGALTGAQALAGVQVENNLLIILDYQLPDMSALELVHQMALQGRLQPFIITANRDEAESAAELLKLGAKDLMLKDETFLRRLPVVVAATVKTLYNEIVLKELENALRFNFQKYQGLYETIFDGVGIFVPTEDGRDFICKDFNGAGARILNREREDLFGKNLWDIFGKIRSDELFNVFRSVMEKGEPETIHQNEYVIKQLKRWLSFKIAPLPGGEIMAVFEDRTDQISAEHALLQSEKRYLSTVDESPVFISRFLPNGEITFMNQTLCRYLGEKPESVLGRNFIEYVYIDEWNMFLKIIKSITKANPEVTLENSVNLPRAKTRWHRWIIRGVFMGNYLVECLACGWDITEERASKESMMMMTTAINNLRSECYIIDKRGRILRVNKAVIDLTGYSEKELYEEINLRDVNYKMSIEDWENFWADLQRYQSVTFDSMHRTRAGKTYPVEITAELMKFNNNDFAFIIARDIANRKASERGGGGGGAGLEIESILNNVSDPFFTIDDKMLITYINPAAAGVLRVAPEDVLHRHFFEIFPKAKGSAFDTLYMYAMKVKKAFSFETFLSNEPNSPWFTINVFPFDGGMSVFLRSAGQKAAPPASSGSGSIPGIGLGKKEPPTNVSKIFGKR